MVDATLIDECCRGLFTFPLPQYDVCVFLLAQSACVAPLLKELYSSSCLARTGVVLTIHNIAFQVRMQSCQDIAKRYCIMTCSVIAPVMALCLCLIHPLRIFPL